MHDSPHSHTGPSDQLRSFLALHRRTWLPPTVVCGGLALLAALMVSRYWEASQAVVVRQDATASDAHPGKFADLYEMRTRQETILELARSHQVVSETLQIADELGDAEPSLADIEEFRNRLDMSPPGGAEFGKTEVFYLSVQDPSRDRALRLVAALCKRLDHRLQSLRKDQAGGLILELSEQLAAAEAQHSDLTGKLAEYEAQVGADLGELRLLHSAFGGQSDLRQQYVALESDARRYKEQARETRQLIELLQASRNDVSRFTALPNSLLTALPALRQLKDGLVDAQLQTANLQGTRSAVHPRVKASIEAEASIRRDLVKEMQAAVTSAQAELALAESRYEASRGQLEQVKGRLDQLAEKRAEYTNRVSAVEASRESVDQVRRQLSSARASQAAAQTASVLTLVDGPETGPSPSGPGRAKMVLAGLLGGFTIGLGLIFYPTIASMNETEAEPSPAAGAEAASDRTATEAPVREWWEEPAASEPAQASEPARVVAESPVDAPAPATADAQTDVSADLVSAVETGAESAGQSTHNESTTEPDVVVRPAVANEEVEANVAEVAESVAESVAEPRVEPTVVLTTPVDFAPPTAAATPVRDPAAEAAMRQAFTPTQG